MSSQGFQNAVNVQPAVGVEGDFCNVNPRWSVSAGPGGLVAGPNGLTIGRFAWIVNYPQDPNAAGITANNTGSGNVAGFVGRNQQGLITTYLADAGMVIPAGFECVVYNGGDFWVKNNGTTQVVPGQTCYANYADGKASFSASTATSTSFTISAQTFSVTASISGDVMSVTAVGSGTLYPGSVLSGTGVPTGMTILSQLTSTESGGTLGARGTYAVSVGELTIASETITGTYGLLTLGGTITGTFGLGDSLTGTSVAAGSTITANASNGASLTGAGGAGTYVTLTATASSGTITGATNIATNWTARSGGLAGELIKISDHPT